MNRGFQRPHSISGSGDSGDKIGLIHSGGKVTHCSCLFFVQHGSPSKARAPNKTGITFKPQEVRHRVTAGAGCGGRAACCLTWCGGRQSAQVLREKEPGPPPIRAAPGHGHTARPLTHPGRISRGRCGSSGYAPGQAGGACNRRACPCQGSGIHGPAGRGPPPQDQSPGTPHP